MPLKSRDRLLERSLLFHRPYQTGGFMLQGDYNGCFTGFQGASWMFTEWMVIAPLIVEEQAGVVTWRYE